MKTCKLTPLNWVLILFLLTNFSNHLNAKPLKRFFDANMNQYQWNVTSVFFSENDIERINMPVPSPPPGDCSDLFISEYIEGSSSNKAIEIYNPTSAAIDLSDYSIRYYNGSSNSVSGTYSDWSGTIPSKGTIVVRNNNAAISGITSVANFTTTSSALNFNGNDAVSLYKDGTLIDIIGPIGSSSNFAKDRTMVRKSTVGQGLTTYNSSEWDVNSQNFTDSLGGHYSSVCAVVAPPTCDTDTTINYSNCDSVIYADSTYFVSTIISDTLLNTESCDSVITRNINVYSSYNIVLPEQFGIDSVMFGGSTYYASQTVNLSLNTVNGCDSLVEFNVSILNSEDIDTLGFQSFELEGDTWNYTINESEYNSSGDVWDAVQSLFSVSSTEGDYFWGMRDLENPISSSNLHTMSFDPIDVSGYSGISFTFDYYSSLYGGSDFVNYSIQFDNGSHWDSIIDLNNDSDAWLTEEITVPEGTQYVRLQLRGDFNGGSDYAAFDNVLLYGVSQPSACSHKDTLLTVEACESYTYSDSIYVSSTQIVDSLTQANTGCDSVVTINLTINQPTLFTDVQSACESYTWINGVTYTESNSIAKDTLVAANGCDSIVSLDLTINNEVFFTDIQSACESYTWINGVTYTESNSIAKDTLVAANGCDSIISLVLTINNEVFFTDIQSACESYTWINGVTYTESNSIAKDTLETVSGCDSIVSLDLTINNEVFFTDVQIACESYTWINGVTYTESNSIAKDTLVASNGCDSIVSLDLTIKDVATFTDVQIACDSYTWINGVTYTESNSIAKDTLVAANGCDSIVSLDLTIKDVATFTDVQIACDSYTWINGVTYTESNSMAKDTLVASNGCDSIISLELIINNPVSSIDVQEACGTYTWINGVTYTESNSTAKDTLVAANGCDSIVSLNLSISNTLSSTDIQESCEPFTWINGITYTESNSTAVDTLTSVNGCDSVVTLQLTINEPSYGTQVETAFGTFTWTNGITYTESTTTAKDTLVNTQGCDSIVSLDLTILQEYCTLRSTRNRYEWIKQVELEDDINNATSKESGGYGIYNLDTLNVDTNTIVSITLTPGYRRRVYEEYWRIWVDWNYDGDFNDVGEKVFEQKGKSVRTGEFTVPVNVSANALRMRVAMRWRRYAPSCGTYRNGEAEDYIIQVNGAQGAINNADVRLMQMEEASGEWIEFSELYPNPVSQGELVSGYIRVEETGVKILKIMNALGQIVKTVTLDCQEEESRFQIPTEGMKKGIYFININNGLETTKIVVK